LTAIKKKALKVANPMKFVFGYFNGDALDSSSSEMYNEEVENRMEEED
jgi:hypothetical protein